MITKYAFLKNNVVILVEDIDSNNYGDYSSGWDSIIDVSNYTLTPTPGWLLQNSTLVPVSTFDQQVAQRIFGQDLAIKAVDLFGSKNLELSYQGNTVNISSLLTNLASIKMLLETGALKTARSLIGMIKPLYPDYTSIFDTISNEITTFLTSRGWE